jgi:hypothetical protein
MDQVEELANLTDGTPRSATAVPARPSGRAAHLAWRLIAWTDEIAEVPPFAISSPGSADRPPLRKAASLPARRRQRQRQLGTDRLAEPVDAAQLPPAARDGRALNTPVSSNVQDAARGLVTDRKALRRAVDRPSSILSPAAVYTRVHEHVEEEADHHRRSADPGRSSRPVSAYSSAASRAGQVLLPLAVVAVHRRGRGWRRDAPPPASEQVRDLASTSTSRNAGIL